ncbi:MFS transporter [Flavobacterium subsaxonicum]|uniref:Major facilitator transporter n=1 Tax=Flavobacterium subsaxonicum WB 4.1-42 = DSM 21790 TaxID=1121898 RepID=A0A0A2MZY9_9FLAO|nr:MFS transporter [Flavobacterium subsaxonicum]KGO93775.1 major facilitator transporter [Flavobacterium subsaxonicum WB 4.1-42 = DSM 21790]
MLKQAFNRYINNFRGFTREVWILTIVTFINRSGSMVLPFLSKYLKENLDFTYGQVSWIIVSFGLGSMAGSWIGGKLSDKIGFYKVMVFSLFASGLMFFVVQQITTFAGLCVAMFALLAIADMFRPAMFVSIRTYAKPENRTRAMTLVRMAVNLGMSAGPAIGGFIILTLGYKGLFWIDGSSCIIAIVLFFLLVKEKKPTPAGTTHIETEVAAVTSPFKDVSYLLFLFISLTIAIVFFQLFTSLPLYHKEWYGLTEVYTGLLLSLNGIMIFFFEMPIVGFLERKNIPKIKIILWSAVLISVGFFVLLINTWAGILVISMLFITLAEMFCFPFSNSFALGRAPRGQEGRYMALYTMTFSLAQIMSGKMGMDIIAAYGYNNNWIVMGCTALLAAVACIILHRRMLSGKV